MRGVYCAHCKILILMKWIHLIYSIIILFMSSDTFAQPKFVKDSVLVIMYNEKNSLPHNPGYHITNQRKLIIDGNTSYYFISNPQFQNVDSFKMRASIIKYIDSNYILFNQPMMPKYDRYTYFSDSLHNMKWQLTGRKELINGRFGYEAKTFFRGRNFTAWYDPTIPFQNGPLKFGGLPGLIIKFYDKEHIWFFELASIMKEKRQFNIDNIHYAGDYQTYLTIFPEWDRKTRERDNANQSIDPNCPTCGSKNKHYSIEMN